MQVKNGWQINKQKLKINKQAIRNLKYSPSSLTNFHRNKKIRTMHGCLCSLHSTKSQIKETAVCQSSDRKEKKKEIKTGKRLKLNILLQPGLCFKKGRQAQNVHILTAPSHLKSSFLDITTLSTAHISTNSKQKAFCLNQPLVS